MTEKKKRRGQPPLYETPEQLQAAVDKYFEDCKGHLVYDKDGRVKLDGKGKPVIEGETPLTIAGLSYALGFSNRKIFTQQKRRGPEFADVVLLAKLRIEIYSEERLYSRKTYKGSMHYLCKAFGWKPSGYIVHEEEPADGIRITIDNPGTSETGSRRDEVIWIGSANLNN